MALTTIDVHGIILEPVTNTPAVGTVTFKILQDLRDTVDNIVYSPQTFMATLDASGEFTITLPTTDNPDITPLDWTYWVYVDTDVWNSGVFYMALPAALGPVAEFADIIPILSNDCTPDGTACAPISVVGQVASLEAEVALQGADIAVLQGDVSALEVTVTALVNQVNILTPQVTANSAAIVNLNGQVADLFNNYVGRLTAGVATFGPIASLDTESQNIQPSGLMIDNDFNRQAFLVSLGDAFALSELEITAISAVDDATTEVQVTNTGALASPVFEVVVLHIHN